MGFLRNVQDLLFYQKSKSMPLTEENYVLCTLCSEIPCSSYICPKNHDSLIITIQEVLFTSYMICYCFCSGPAQAAKMREIKVFAARHTYSPHAPHLQFVGDTIGALGWVVAGDKPIHFIRESYDGGKHHVKHIPGEMSVSNFCQMSLPTYLFK